MTTFPCFADGALGQDEVGRHTAIRAEPDQRVRIVLVLPAISLRRSLDAHLGRMKIAPAGARLAAERAVALVDIVRLLRGLDADPAAEAGEVQHPLF